MRDANFINTVLGLVEKDYETALWYLQGFDPDVFFEQCQGQQVAGLCYSLLENARSAGEVPERLLSRLREPYLEQWAANERHLWAIEDLQHVFRSAQQEFILLKGVYLAQRFYGAPDLRAIGDIDILVQRRKLEAVSELLRHSGFECRTPLVFGKNKSLEFVYDLTFVKPDSIVEVHHSLRAHPSLKLDEGDIWSRRQQFTVAGNNYWVLPDDYTLLLQLFGIHTDVALGEITLRNFIDLHRVIETLGAAIDWDEFLAARKDDKTHKICVNTLALWLCVCQLEHRFPELAQALCRNRDLLVGAADRHEYLELIAASSFRLRKEWTFRQYDSPLSRTIEWWLTGLPQRFASKPKAILERATGGSKPSRWTPPAGQSTNGKGNLRLRREFDIDGSILQKALLRLGSLTAGFHYSRAVYRKMVEDLFRLVIEEEASPAPDVEIYVFDTDLRTLRRQRPPKRPVVQHHLEQITEIHHDIATARIFEATTPKEILISMMPKRQSDAHLLHCLMVVLYKVLYQLGRVQLHSAAIRFAGATNLFVGDKGAGKSTIGLSLGRAGGIVLSDDHVMLHRKNGAYVVAGCDGNMRLTRKTEKHFFSESVSGPTRLHAGVPKKEIRITDHLEGTPYVDSQVDRIFFPKLDEKFSIRKMTAQTALLRLVEAVRDRHRVADLDDATGFIDFFATLVESVELYELSLSPDLEDLGKLESFLRGGAAPEKAQAQ